jgi:hypothetical protein
MDYIIYTIIFFFIYGISSIIWFICALSHKHEKTDKLIDYLMYPMFFVIITIITFISTKMEWNK